MVYTDGWPSYLPLSAHGYNHYTVEHKHAFKTVYVNPDTQERIEDHTKRIKGSWKHAKVSFTTITIWTVSPWRSLLALP